MRDSRTKPWRRLASRRASRRRHTPLAPPERAVREPGPLPPLEPPDDDREFQPHPHALPPFLVPTPRLEPA